MKEGRVCPLCDRGKLVRDTRKIISAYRGVPIEIDQPGLYCDACGESFLSPEEARIGDNELRRIRGELVNYLSPDEIKEIRGYLGISQKDAGALLGGGPTAFSKYERGETLQSKPLDILLRMLRNGSLSVEEIRNPSSASLLEESVVTATIVESTRETMPFEQEGMLIPIGQFTMSIAVSEAKQVGSSPAVYLGNIIKNTLYEKWMANILSEERHPNSDYSGSPLIAGSQCKTTVQGEESTEGLSRDPYCIEDFFSPVHV